MSHTLSASGVFMGEKLNVSGDMLPPEPLYEACRVLGRHVRHLGGLNWDFQSLHTQPIDPAFTQLVETYLAPVLVNPAPHKGWKLPETTLIYPWIVRLYPEARYIHWVRDPRDSIAGGHLTDDLADFGVPYDPTDELSQRRAISWKYQRAIMKSTPPPRHHILVRFEDFVLQQDATLARLEAFLGFPLARIPVRPETVGRWRHQTGARSYASLAEDIRELAYDLE